MADWARISLLARVASNDPKTKFGVPEVQLGILPGLGGTQRLPRLVGLEKALDLLLTGKQIDAQRALGMGLIDELVPKERLLEAAVRLALSRALEGSARKSRWRRWFDGARLREFALAENPIGRQLLFERAKRALLRETQGNYPAPERILEVVKLGLAERLGERPWGRSWRVRRTRRERRSSRPTPRVLRQYRIEEGQRSRRCRDREPPNSARGWCSGGPDGVQHRLPDRGGS